MKYENHNLQHKIQIIKLLLRNGKWRRILRWMNRVSNTSSSTNMMFRPHVMNICLRSKRSHGNCFSHRNLDFPKIERLIAFLSWQSCRPRCSYSTLQFTRYHSFESFYGRASRYWFGCPLRTTKSYVVFEMQRKG